MNARLDAQSSREAATGSSVTVLPAQLDSVLADIQEGGQWP
jgi:hypothetical protein